MATYLQLVNNVLSRMREDDVASVTSTDYSTLIGKLVNDSKRQVEDAWKWNMFYTSISVALSAGVTTYAVTGSGLRHRDAVINDTTNQNRLHNVPLQWIIDQQQLSNVSQQEPAYYSWAGNNGTDSRIEIYPTPKGSTTLKVNLYVPQADLSANTDVILVSPYVVELGAYARAIAERGEDGGLNSSEAYGLFKGALSDEIAQEASRFIENDCWVPR